MDDKQETALTGVDAEALRTNLTEARTQVFGMDAAIITETDYADAVVAAQLAGGNPAPSTEARSDRQLQKRREGRDIMTNKYDFPSAVKQLEALRTSIQTAKAELASVTNQLQSAKEQYGALLLSPQLDADGNKVSVPVPETLKLLQAQKEGLEAYIPLAEQRLVSNTDKTIDEALPLLLTQLKERQFLVDADVKVAGQEILTALVHLAEGKGQTYACNIVNAGSVLGGAIIGVIVADKSLTSGGKQEHIKTDETAVNKIVKMKGTAASLTSFLPLWKAKTK